MKAVLYKKGGRAHASVCDVPAPVCGENEVLVRVMACGICKPADSRHDNGTSMMGVYPVIPGHEFSGIVEKVGSGVKHFKPGDRVAVDNGAPCGTCYFCQRGDFALCEDYRAMGQNINGGFAELAVAPETHVYAVPDNVSMKAAALSELVGCCYHCIDRSQIQQADDILILGCGASGMLMAMLAKHTAAASVTVIDSVPSKLEKAAAQGVETVLVDRTDHSKHEAVLKERFPRGFDVIIDAIGDAQLIEESLPLLKKKGRFLNYSFAVTEKKDVTINMAMFASRDLTYMGSTFQHHNFGQVLRSMSAGRVQPEVTISDTYPIDRYFEALDRNLRDPDCVKIIIEPNGPSDGK